jgi:hypothetical protein
MIQAKGLLLLLLLSFQQTNSDLFAATNKSEFVSIT